MSIKTNAHEYTVTSLSSSLKKTVEESFSFVRVRGEISGFKRAPSGHLYMSLKDDKSVLSAICWKGVGDKLPFQIEDGLEVICQGRITTYAGQSKYQLIIETIEASGVGALMALLEKRKQLLSKEGLFDPTRKKPLPFLPEKIGIITSPTGAVIEDIKHRISERFPRHLMLWPVLVQGEKAAMQIKNAIEGFNSLKNPPNVIIVARGGGSIEDLWPFNEEIVVRAVANSAIAIISAVGHETDTTLIDYAADVRAPTPTAAAEFAVPVRSELIIYTQDLARRMQSLMLNKLDNNNQSLQSLARYLPKPLQLLEDKIQALDSISIRLSNSLPKLIELKANMFQASFRGLLSPERLIADKSQKLQHLSTNLARSLPDLINLKSAKLSLLHAKIVKPDRLFEMSLLRLTNISKSLSNIFDKIVHDKQRDIMHVSKLMASYHYKNVLKRGFSMVKDSKGNLITSKEDMQKGNIFNIEFFDGEKKVTPITKNSRKADVSKKQDSLF